MSKTITLNHITKIEGHANLTLKLGKGKVEVCELGSVEGSRYFEGMVRGRKYFEAHEMTSRICGICSTAHVMAAITAIERACEFKPSKQTEELRDLLNLGERIRSHATHLHFLALPDYTGYESALAMAPKFKKELEVALRLMKLGNYIVSLVGGRDLHPVSATVGGWLKIPEPHELAKLEFDLEDAKKDVRKVIKLFYSLTYPQFETKAEMFSLVHKKEFGMLRGDIQSNQHKFKQEKYREFMEEYHQDYSTANFVTKDGKRIMVGALARMNNCFDNLYPEARRLAKKLPSKNPFYQNLAQAIELMHSLEHAIKICRRLPLDDEPMQKVKPKKGVGIGAVEAPRGTLFHEYKLDKEGIILDANIITPTAQNLFSIQEDIREFIPQIMNKSKNDIIMDIEKLIRSHDPCFSCSSHFLEVKWL